MLLKHTPAEASERESLVVNPAKTCQPIGAMYAALGIHACLPHSHGSQGCCSYHRSTLTRHYKEPVMAATSSFTEGSSVFGGQANLIQALGTIFDVYNPEVVAVHTTCLSETIGDDIPQIVSKAKAEGKIPDGRWVIHCNTPSYVGSHVTGFSSMVKAMVDYFAEANPGGKKGADGAINVIPGWIEPSDMREIKRILDVLGIRATVFPDTSDVLDTPLTGNFRMFPKGGTTVSELRKIGGAVRTFALGRLASSAAARALDARCKVSFDVLDLPLGLAATDRLVDALRLAAGVPVPESLTAERGRLIDMMADMHQYTYGRTVALVGDPDQLVSLTEFFISLDMKPIHVLTGTSGAKFQTRIEEIVRPIGRGVNVKQAGDMLTFHQWIKAERPDLIVGNTYCKYIARDEDIPFMRFGFPIMDRVGHGVFPSVGYTGAMRTLERMLGIVMDRMDRDAPAERFELVM